MVGGRATGLDDENIRAAYVFVDFYFSFTVGEGGYMDVGKRLAEVFCDAFGEGAVRGSTDDFHGQNERYTGRRADC